MIKEICVESYIEAVEGEKKGANRIELCDNLEVGGTTPSYGTIKQTLSKVKIPVFVMIRPRGGNFCYSKEEIEIMKEDIKICNSLGVKGVVLGVLKKNNEIDYEVLEELMKETMGMEVTFHKAIDEVENPLEEIPKLIKSGVKRILSSGGKPKVLEGEKLLNRMIEIGKDKIEIIVCGGVTSENFQEVSNLIKTNEYHGKKIV